MKLSMNALLALVVAKTEAVIYPGAIDPVVSATPGKEYAGWRSFSYVFGNPSGFVRKQTEQKELPKCSTLPKSGDGAWDICIRDEQFHYKYSSDATCTIGRGESYGGPSLGASGGCTPRTPGTDSAWTTQPGPPMPVLCFGAKVKSWPKWTMDKKAYCYPLPDCDLKTVFTDHYWNMHKLKVQECPAGMQCCSNEPSGIYLKEQYTHSNYHKTWSYCFRRPDVPKCATPAPTPEPTAFPTLAPTKDVPVPCKSTTCEIRDGSTVVMGEAPEGEKWHCSNESGECKCMCHDTFACTIEHHANFGFKKMNHCAPLRTA